MQLEPDFLLLLKNARNRLVSLIDQFNQVKVLVIGDLTLDEFLNGQVERISREAPVLILRHEYTRQVPGGGANAVYNLAKLGAQVKVAGLIGADSQGIALKHIFEEERIDTTGMLIDPTRPTVTKTRISGHARQSVTQQIVRVDRKSHQPPQLEIQLQLANYIRSCLDQVDLVVCSDYGEGVFGQMVIDAALCHPKTVVDAQSGLDRYQQAMIFTPNVPEAELATGVAIKNDSSLKEAALKLIQITNAQQLLITRGDEGMSYCDRTGILTHIPPFNKTDVFDVTGAGDTVVAALTLALGNQASFWEAAVLGNLAASIVVRHFGTATTSTQELKEALFKLIGDDDS